MNVLSYFELISLDTLITHIMLILAYKNGQMKIIIELVHAYHTLKSNHILLLVL